MLNNSSPSVPHRNIYYSSSQRKSGIEEKNSPITISKSNHLLSSDDSAESGKLSVKAHTGDSVDISASRSDNNMGPYAKQPLEIDEEEGLLGSSKGESDAGWRGKEGDIDDNDLFGKISIGISYSMIVLGNAFQQGGFPQCFMTLCNLI